jgi:hypothetical protein
MIYRDGFFGLFFFVMLSGSLSTPFDSAQGDNKRDVSYFLMFFPVVPLKRSL